MRNFDNNTSVPSPTGTQASNNASDRSGSASQQEASNTQDQAGTPAAQPSTETQPQQQPQSQQQQPPSQQQPASQPEVSREEQQNTENSQEQQQEGVVQQEQAERDAVPVVLIDVPNPEADNAANASAGARQENAQPATEAMDVDSDGGGEEECTGLPGVSMPWIIVCAGSSPFTVGPQYLQGLPYRDPL